MITIFTDGASRGNPGPGGWAYIFSDGKHAVEKGGHVEHTTNNRMEMMGALEALKYVEKTKDQSFVTVHTDSAYLINGVTKWLAGWERNNWQTKTKEPVKNEDLWRDLADVVSDKDIKWVRVSGHAGVPGNERVDEIATAYADGGTPELFSGSQADYKIDTTIIRSSPSDKKNKKSRQGEAYSYVSSVDGKIQIHKTWKECEARVKGVSKTRFKKSLSKEDEQNIVKDFNIS